MRNRTLLTVAALALIGCSSLTSPAPDRSETLLGGHRGEVTFQPLQTKYSYGDTVDILLRNGSDESIGYNFCHSAREQSEGGAWVRYEPLRVCTQMLYILDPANETLLREPVAEEWQAGDQRILMRVEFLESGESDEIATVSFRVVP